MNTFILSIVFMVPPGDEGSLANMRPPSQYQLEKEARKARVKAARQKKAAVEAKARRYRLRKRQYDTGRRVRASYNYQRRTLPTLAQLAGEAMQYEHMAALGLVRPPSCWQSRRR